MPPGLTSWVGTLGRAAEAPVPGADLNAKSPAQGVAAAPAQLLPVAATAAEITGSGYVTAPTTTTLYALHTDRIVAVPVALGDRVTAGQPLVQMEGTGQQFALERATLAQATLALDVRARTIDLDQAEADFARNRHLADRGVAAQTKVDDARIGVEQAQLDLDRARQQLAQSALDVRVAQDAVDRLIVRAPFAGTVADLTARTGMTVYEPGGPDSGESRLMTIIDTADLVIDADFAEQNTATFQHAITAEAVLDAFPDQPFAITLDRIAAVASAQRGTIAVRFRCHNPPAGMRPNMAVRIRVTGAAADIASRSNGP